MINKLLKDGHTYPFYSEALLLQKTGIRKEDIFRERGDNGLFLTLVQKFYNNVFLFLDLTTLGTSVKG